MPLYPATPVPAAQEVLLSRWPAIEVEFDSVYRQVRQLTNRPLRIVRLKYENLTGVQKDDLEVFFNQQEGKATRFDYKHLLDPLWDRGFEVGDTDHWIFDSGASITTVAADVRSGVKAGKITALNGTERRIHSLQKIMMFPGDEVNVSGYAKASSGAGGLGSVFIEFGDQADVFVSGGPLVDATFTTSYAQYAGTIVTVPANVVYGRVRVRSRTGATTGVDLFFDDLAVDLRLDVRYADDQLSFEYHTSRRRYSCVVELEEAP